MLTRVKQRLNSYNSLPLLILITSMLSACDGGKPPTESWEVASKGLFSACLSDNSQFSLIGSITHGGSLWSLQEDKRLFDWNHKQGQYSNIIACAFSPESRFAATADHQTIVLWNTDSGAALTFWSAPNEVLSMALSPNGNYALLGLGDYTAVMFDVKRGGISRTFQHRNRVRSVALSADGKLALTGSEDETAALWSVESGELLYRWQLGDEVHTVAITRDGNTAFTMAKYDQAALWNTRTGEKLGVIPLRPTALQRGQMFSSAEFSDDGKLLLTGSSDQLVQLWDTANFKELAR